MAVTWSWEENMGQIVGRAPITNKKFTAQIFEGNCPLIALKEFKNNGEKEYQMYMFFVDDSHAKKCLGLTKMRDGKKENIYPEIKKLRLNKNKRDFKKIVQWFTEAYDDLTIEIYTENGNEKGDK